MRHLPSVNSHGSEYSHSILLPCLEYGKSCAKVKCLGGDRVGVFFEFFLLHSEPIGFFPLPLIYFILNPKIISNGESKRNLLRNGCQNVSMYGRTASFGTFFLCVWRMLTPLYILPCLLQDILLISILHLGSSFNLLSFIIQSDVFIIYMGNG